MFIHSVRCDGDVKKLPTLHTVQVFYFAVFFCKNGNNDGCCQVSQSLKEEREEVRMDAIVGDGHYSCQTIDEEK